MFSILNHNIILARLLRKPGRALYIASSAVYPTLTIDKVIITAHYWKYRRYIAKNNIPGKDQRQKQQIPPHIIFL